VLERHLGDDLDGHAATRYRDMLDRYADVIARERARDA
jgi:hypothetical protein